MEDRISKMRGNVKRGWRLGENVIEGFWQGGDN